MCRATALCVLIVEDIPITSLFKTFKVILINWLVDKKNAAYIVLPFIIFY